jgi:TIR domain-containing protein
MKVFISHSLSDKELARDVAQGLADEGFDVWFDEWTLHPGDNFAKKIGKALESADAMVVVVSPKGINEGWQRQEIQYALATPRFEGRLVPVIVKQSPEIPWILEKMDVVRPGRTGAETARRVIKALQHVTVG